MAKNLGMTPATVAEQARSMHSHMSVLDSIISDIAHAGEASRWPGPFGLLPGNKIMTEGSILLSENAATDVQLAVDAAAELLERLQVSIGEQNEASAAGDGYHDGTTSKRYADDLYLRAMNDPTALEGMTPAWIDRVAATIRAIAPNQLVASGRRFGVDEASLVSPLVDLVDVHYYPPTAELLSADAARVASAGKVYIAGEYGSISAETELLRAAAVDPSIGGMFFWSLFGRREDGSFVEHDDGFTLHYPGTDDGMRANVAAIQEYSRTIGALG